MAYIKLLKDVPLDNSYDNPIYFGNANLPNGFTKVNYDNFFSKFDVNWQPTTTDLKMNIRIGDGVNTTIIIPEQQWQPAYNYCIIKYEDNEVMPSKHSGARIYNYYYYFITNCVPLGKGNYAVTLELDILTTYLPYMNVDHKLFTERKHCNRWNNGFYLNWQDAIMGDDIDTTFRANKLVGITKDVTYQYVSASNIATPTHVNTWNEYSSKTLWCYMFFTKNPIDIIKTKDSDRAFKPLIIKRSDGQKYNTQLMCIAIPCGKCYFTLSNLSFTFEYTNDSEIFNKLIQSPGCIGAKMSFRPPFEDTYEYFTEINGTKYGWVDIPSYDTMNILKTTLVDETYECNDDYVCDSLNVGNVTLFQCFKASLTQDKVYRAFMCVREISKSLFNSSGITLDIPNKDTFESIYNSYKVDKSYDYEPKLYCEPFYNFEIRTQYGGAYKYNPLAFESTSVKIRYCCEISPEPDKIYAQLYSDNYNIYSELNECNVGLLIINDNNIPYKQDAYETYLREHRASAITGVAVQSVTGSVGGSVAGAITGSKGGVAGAIAGGIIGGVTGLVSPIVQYTSTLVDLKNTPDAIRNMGNNPMHDFLIGNPITPYIIKYELFDNEKQQVFDYFYDNGYKVNRKCNIDLHDYSNTEQIITRQKFNYIKVKDNFVNEIKFTAGIGITLTKIYVPQIVKQKINLLFNRGFKLWTLIYKNVANATWEDFYLGSDFENAEIVLPQ